MRPVFAAMAFAVRSVVAFIVAVETVMVPPVSSAYSTTSVMDWNSESDTTPIMVTCSESRQTGSSIS